MQVGSDSGGRGTRSQKKDSDYHRRMVFSPDGRLYQAEYALKYVKLSRNTAVAVRGADSVVVMIHRNTTDPLLDRTTPTFSHVFEIAKGIGLIAIGMEADGKALAHDARNAAAEFRFKWGYEMSPSMLAQWIAGRAQIRTQHVGVRPYGVVAMIVGIDQEKGTPQLFTCDPAGQVFGHKAASAGVRDTAAMVFLENALREDPFLPHNSTLMMAFSAMRHVLEDFKAYDIDVGIATKQYPYFKTYSKPSGSFLAT